MLIVWFCQRIIGKTILVCSLNMIIVVRRGSAISYDKLRVNTSLEYKLCAMFPCKFILTITSRTIKGSISLDTRIWTKTKTKANDFFIRITQIWSLVIVKKITKRTLTDSNCYFQKGIFAMPWEKVTKYMLQYFLTGQKMDEPRCYDSYDFLKISA